MEMTPEHKEKLRVARANAREARKNAVDVEEVVGSVSEYNEVDELKAELAALKEKHREKAAHEHKPFSQEKINDRTVSGVQDEIKESLRELLREQLAESFPERDIVRKTARDSVRPGAVIAHDRDGNPIFRKRDNTRDPFAVPDDLQERGWSYQWVRVSTYGQEDVSNQVSMLENGWRFVPADREKWRGRFMPENYTGHIFKDGLALMERPETLTREAQEEAMKNVQAQSRAQREQFGMALPDGFSANTPGAKQHTFARQGKAEPTPSTLRPNLRVDGGMDIE